MAVRTIDCSACGMAVPYGRLSCPDCGELLASVAGAARRLTSVAALGDSPRPMAATIIQQGVVEAADTEPIAAEPTEPDIAEPDVSLDAVAVELEDAEQDPEPEPAAWEPLNPAHVAAPVLSPSVAEPPPGSYVPPAPAPLQPTLAQPAGLPAPARAWGGIGSATAATPGATAVTGGGSDRDALSLTDPARRAEAIGWLAVAGAAVGAAGFLLPWARTIIGADGVGYLDTWGFAGPGHPLVVIGLLTVLALAVVKNPIPAWARLGIPGLAFGSLLVGMLWPYVMGPLGPLPGAYLSLIGAVVLVVAAIASLATDRHAPTHSGV